MAQKRIGKIQISGLEAVPFRGGVDTVRERALVTSGGYSMMQNMRNRHPGLEKREGHMKHHITADSTNQVLSLYQFSKGKTTSAERHFFGQFGDNDILEATNAPPYNLAASAVFGTEVFSSTGTMLPCTWSHVDDVLLMSNGVDQHKAYAGTANYVKKFVLFRGSAAPPSIPSEGFDYTLEVSDGDTGTYADIGSLNTIAAYDCLYICTPIPANRLTWTLGNFNGTGAVGTLKYWKSDGTWADTSETDGTIATGCTMGASGSMTWAYPTDERPRYMYGISGYWYQWETATQLDSSVTVTGLTYGTDGAATGTRTSFVDIANVWDGVPQYAIEARFYDASESVYFTYSSDSVEIDSATASDKIYFNYPDQLEGIYIDVGETPNTTASTTINAMYCYNGTGFAAVTILQDETNGMANSGWVTWKRPTTEHPTQFQNAKYDSYWYYFTVDKTLSDDVLISIEAMPYFDINDLGKSRTSAVWKDRACYTFNRWPQYVYISAMNNPLYLNGDDFGILQAGDGRANDIVCMLPFYNELLVWQEEKGFEGGCLTLFQGLSPSTWGKLLLSSRIGTFNSKSAIVIDGVLTSTATDESLKTLAFFLSHYGVCCTDGKTVTIISDPIQNYFNPLKSECIRRGYDNENWIGYDSAYNVLLLGLVSGKAIMTSTATSTTASKLVDTAGAFTTRKSVTNYPISHTIRIGDTVYNTTDKTTALITALDSATTLSLDTDIMASGEGYEIYASTPNVFPVFDLTDKTWGFDKRGQGLSCMTEVEAASGEIPILQYGGGTSDGLVYRLNASSATATGHTAISDVATAIDGFVTVEISKGGLFLFLRELLIRCKAQSAGNITITPYRNGKEGTAFTLSMVAETSGDEFRRHRIGQKVQDSQISLKIQNATVAQSLYLLDMGLSLLVMESH